MASRTIRPGRRSGLPERLWSLRETATFLGITPENLYELNHAGTGPRYSKVGKFCRYDPRDVEEYLADNSSDRRTA